MLSIDTNVLIRLLTRDEPRQTAIAESSIQKGAWVPIVVLTEAVWVLSAVYNRSSEELARALEMLLNHDQLTLQDSDAVASALTTFRSKSAPGFSDCLILELARKAGHLPLGTFDKGLAKLAGTQRL